MSQGEPGGPTQWYPQQVPQQEDTIRWPAAAIGIGIGGLVDSIVFRQLLQWHHSLVGADPRLQAVPWVLVVTGIAVLFVRLFGERRQVFRARELWGMVLLTWGLANLLEGLVIHQILGLHHVPPGPPDLLWDLGWLAVAGAMLASGGFLAWTGGDARHHQLKCDVERRIGAQRAWSPLLRDEGGEDLSRP